MLVEGPSGQFMLLNVCYSASGLDEVVIGHLAVLF